MTKDKESVKDLVLKERERVVAEVNNYVSIKNRIEMEYDKFFDEISKRSKNFTLTKVKGSYSKNVNYRYNNGPSVFIDKISETFNNCKITYCGELPEGMSPVIDINVEEHVKRSRRSYWGENLGFKLILNINYGGEKYYKSVGSFIAAVEGFVEEIWKDFNRERTIKQQQELANKIAKEKFNGEVNTYHNHIIVWYSNGVKIKYYFYANLEKNEVIFRFANVDLTKLTSNTNPELIINLSNQLGSL
jgi:hypothetical protein